jgi:rubrerythrin
MTPTRHGEVDLPELLRRNHATLTHPAARDIAARALASLSHHTDVAESDVNQHIWGCYGCGRLVEGDRPDSCPACGALAVEFRGSLHSGAHHPDRG